MKNTLTTAVKMYLRNEMRIRASKSAIAEAIQDGDSDDQRAYERKLEKEEAIREALVAAFNEEEISVLMYGAYKHTSSDAHDSCFVAAPKGTSKSMMVL